MAGHAYEPPIDAPLPRVGVPAPTAHLERGFQVMAYAEAVKRNAYIATLARSQRTHTPVPAWKVAGNTLASPEGVPPQLPSLSPDLRAVFVGAFGERWQFAWEVARCESAGFRTDVVYGPSTGAAGEVGLFQLHPRGVLPSFYVAGYVDPFDPFQQIEFVAAYTTENGWGAWTCAW